jgi:hypothetical protein
MKDRGDKRKARKTLFIPDMKGVESKRPLAPEGKYRVAVKEITSQQGDNGEYYRWIFEKVDGKGKGATIYHNTSLSDQALWNLRSILESLQVEIPEGEDAELEFDDIIGLEMIADVSHEKFEGKPQARLVDHEPVDGGNEETEDEDDKKKRRAKERREARKGGDKEERSSRKSGSKRKADPEPEEELTAEAIGSMDEDELADVIKEHELDVDLDDFPTLKKKKAAVREAAEEAGVLSE